MFVDSVESATSLSHGTGSDDRARLGFTRGVSKAVVSHTQIAGNSC
jgi:hypothetical protein